jgi:DNA-binding NarL/FixJ family response regulator
MPDPFAPRATLQIPPSHWQAAYTLVNRCGSLRESLWLTLWAFVLRIDSAMSQAGRVETIIRVMVVDDHELVRAGLRTLLQAEPDMQIVAEAATGSQALTRAVSSQPRVVLLDARLPDIPGPDVCRGLCAALPDVAVAMLTTFSDDELVRQCVRAGARGYLLKEIPRLDLASSIRLLAFGESVVDRKVLPHVLAVVRQSVASQDAHGPLTERQRDILRLVADGLSNREVGEQVHLSEFTIKSYIEDLLKQLGARNRVHAAILATRRGWL